MKYNILTTTLISLGLTSTFSVFAETAISPVAKSTGVTESEEHILVTANRTQQDKFLALSANHIIDREQITLLQPQNVTELLDKVAGISVVNQGGAGQNSAVFMRGTNSNHTLVLVDGVRVGSATLGSTNLSAISIAQIERIEIVKGPRAALWGADAIGGVIQIFTKKMTDGETTLTAGIGSNGLWQASVSTGLGNEDHNLTLTLSKEDAEGFNAYQTSASPYDINEPDKDGYDRFALSALGQSKINEQLSLHLASRLDKGSAEYDASYPDSPCWDDYTALCPSYYANEQAHTNYSANLSANYQSVKDINTGLSKWSSTLSIATSENKGETYGNGTLKVNSDEITTKRDQISFLSDYRFLESSNLTLGLDWYNEEVNTNTDKDFWTPGFQSWAVDSREMKAIFVQAKHQVNNFLFEAALRHDDIEHLKAETTYNISAGYQFNQNLLISLSRATAFKAPTFNDLYWPGSGNKNLLPENVTNNELLIRQKFSVNELATGTFEVAMFDSEIENLIAWSPNEYGLWQPANINQAAIKGIEASTELFYGNFSHQVAVAYIDSEDKSTGKALLRRPELTANYAISYDWQPLNISANIHYRDDSEDTEALPSHTTLDLSLSYQATEKLLILAKVNNLFDKSYQTALNYIADGTNYQLSATYHF